jgi:Xaa-Pro aminopeptidase
VSGRFSPAQRAVYEVVLEAQAAAIDKVRPGNHWNEPHEAAVRVITHGLAKLGLLKGAISRLIKEQAYQPYFNHRTGHWLGIDVHDVGDYKVGGEWRVLEAGMALTVEPGIYIRPSSRVSKEFWNIGIRIEDDVLVTNGAAEVLSGALEKAPEAIESLVSAA